MHIWLMMLVWLIEVMALLVLLVRVWERWESVILGLLLIMVRRLLLVTEESRVHKGPRWDAPTRTHRHLLWRSILQGIRTEGTLATFPRPVLLLLLEIVWRVWLLRKGALNLPRGA